MQLKCADRPIMVELTLLTVPCSYHIAVGTIFSEMTTNALFTKHNECVFIETQKAGLLYVRMSVHTHTLTLSHTNANSDSQCSQMIQ
jgi:hypothetical protein